MSYLKKEAAGTTPEPGPRIVHAPRGNTLSCKSWQQEAAMRMIMRPLQRQHIGTMEDRSKVSSSLPLG